MSGIEITRSDLTAVELRLEASKSKDGAVTRRLLALALVLDGHSREESARLAGMDRQTLRDWVHRYNEQGIAGLSNKRPTGLKPRLSAAQCEQVKKWLELGPDVEVDGVVRWRRADIARKIEQTFGVELKERAVGNVLARLGYRRLSVRPRHPQADLEAQAAFKKTSQAR
jgi:transposase